MTGLASKGDRRRLNRIILILIGGSLAALIIVVSMAKPPSGFAPAVLAGTLEQPDIRSGISGYRDAVITEGPAALDPAECGCGIARVKYDDDGAEEPGTVILSDQLKAGDRVRVYRLWVDFQGRMNGGYNLVRRMTPVN